MQTRKGITIVITGLMLWSSTLLGGGYDGDIELVFMVFFINATSTYCCFSNNISPMTVLGFQNHVIHIPTFPEFLTVLPLSLLIAVIGGKYLMKQSLNR